MTLTRQPHWATRGLHAFLLARARAPFVWGANDCALFAADAIEAMTGVDIASDFRGRYHDEASAQALIHSITGGSTVADATAHCAAQHGLVEWTHPLLPGAATWLSCPTRGASSRAWCISMAATSRWSARPGSSASRQPPPPRAGLLSSLMTSFTECYQEMLYKWLVVSIGRPQ